MKRRAASLIGVAIVALGLAWPAAAGRPADRATQAPPATAAQVPPPAAQAPAQPQRDQAPSETTLGVPFFPSMQFIESYDAGSGQRYFIFGTAAGFAEVVAYYKSVLKQRGQLVFEEPATHMFEIGRFREEAMAFPPSITVKDYTWGGMQGYPNPKPNAQPARFPTIVQIVPIPATAPDTKR